MRVGSFPGVLQEVALGQRALADYTHIAGKDLIGQIRELAEPLEGKRVLHVSATAFGGGVSEILYTIVPLMRDIGLDAHWHVILGREEFFNVTKLMHNSLQGDPQSISDQEWEVFEAYNAMNAQSLEEGWDVIIVHDPQPAGLLENAPGQVQALGLALPHRPVDAEPEHAGAAAAADRALRGERLAPAAVRPRGPRRRRANRAAGDRPALAEEHGALARRRGVRLASSSGSTRSDR